MTVTRSIVIGVVLLALFETWFEWSRPRTVVSEADWNAAAAAVRADFRAGDLIEFRPAWLDPLGRKVLGDIMPIEMVARDDDDHFARRVVLSAYGAPRVRETVANFGALTLSREQLSPQSVVYDFTTHFADARVFRADQPCVRAQPNVARCEAAVLEPRVLEIDYRPRRGILIPAAVAPTRLAYDNVPAGKTLVLYLGLHDYYARKSGNGVVSVNVLVDNLTASTFLFRQEEGWARHDIKLPDGATHTIAFTVSARDPAWRSLGLAAEVRP